MPSKTKLCVLAYLVLRQSQNKAADTAPGGRQYCMSWPAPARKCETASGRHFDSHGKHNGAGTQSGLLMVVVGKRK